MATTAITITTTADREDDTAPAVRWEPCTDFHYDATVPPSGICAGCGWPSDDHGLPAAA